MAAAHHFDIVQKLYLAYYQRPADPAGLRYWAEQIEAAGGDASAIVAAFGTSPEALGLYGNIDVGSVGDVVEKIYLALFNRAADAAGKQFFVDGFSAGAFSPASIALAVLSGARNADSAAIAHKLQVAEVFTTLVDGRPLGDAGFGTDSFQATYQGMDDVQAARTFLQAVTSDPATLLNVAQITAQIKSTIADPGDAILGPPPPPPPPFTVTITASDQSPVFTEKAGPDDQSGAVTIHSDLVFSGIGTVTQATVTIANTQPGDELLFTDTAKIAGVVATVGGKVVLTLSARPGQAPANADFEAALESVRFNNTSDTPDTTARTMEFRVGNGTSTSPAATETVAVTATNDAPALALTAGAPVVEDAPATAAGLVVATYAATDPEGNSVVVDFTAGSNAAGHYALNTATREVTLTASGAAFVNGGGTLAAIRLTATDDGVPVESSTQALTPVTTQVNDAPVIDALGASLAYGENDAPTPIAPGATVADADSADFGGGLLTVGFGATGTGSDQLSVLNLGSGAGQIGVAGGVVSYEGQAIGTATGGANGADLVISFNSAAATAAAVQALVRAIAFANTSDNPSTSARSVSFTLVDGDGTAAGGSDTGSTTATVTVTPVNDAPVVALTAGAPVVEDAPATAAGLVVATYTAPTDEEGDAVTVAFTAGSNTAGHYALDTATREVTLTAAGAAFVNGGGILAAISLTATDDGTTPAFSVQAATPVTTLVNDAPTFTLTAGTAVVEDAAATAAGLVVATYTAPTDEEGDAVTVAFTAGSNTAGHYALNTATREVTLTAAGAAFVNGGGILAAISLTATDDGTTPAFSVQTATPVTTLVNDAPTFTLTAGTAVVEDAAATAAGLVVATYTAPTDEEGDAVAVNFTAGSNTAGHYALNTATREVTLTAAGAAFVNGGGILAAISLTATDDGTTPAFSVQSATPVTTLVNDAPVIDALGASLAYVENDGASVIAPDATVTDVDSAHFDGGSLTVGFGATGTTEDQLAVRHVGSGLGQIGVSGADITFGGAVIGSFTGGTNGADLVVTFNSAAATPAAVQALARNITFANTSDNPSTLARTVSFTLVDGDGTDAGGSDTDSTTATVHITAVNDAPVVGGGGTLAYTENGAAAAISPAGTVSDPDSGDFNGGSLTVGFTANGTTADQLVVLHQGTGAGQIGVSGADVTFGGATIGTVAGGTQGGDLVVTFTESAATPAAVQALMQAIGFSNDSDAPSAGPRTVTYTVTDGDGGAQTGLATATVNVTAVNDAPVTVVPASSALGTAMSNVGFAVVGVSISDVDAGSANVQTTVAVTNGVATFALAGGATVAAGANGSASVTLQGTVAQVNAALSTFTFQGADGLAAPTTAVVSVVTNDLGNTGTGGALQSNGGAASTFQIGVIPQVFVIDNSDQVADDASAGTAANPFNTIASFNALAGDGANDVIYLKHGTGTYSEAGGFTLLAGQQLVGQGEALSFTNPVTGEVVAFGAGAAGTTPTVSITGAGNAAVTLAANNTLKGLNLATTLGSQTALSDGNGTVGTLTVSNIDISGNGMAVDIDQGGALNVVIDSLSSSGSAQQGVQLAATGAALTGTFTVTTGSISGATGVGFLVGDGAGLANTGGAVAITYGGTVKASGAASAVSIEDRVAGAGSVTLSGSISRDTGSGTTINVDDIAAGTITLSGASNSHKSSTATALSISDISAGAAVHHSGNLNINITTGGTGIAITNNNGEVSFSGGYINAATKTGSGVSITGGTGSTMFNLTGNGLDIATTTGTGFNVANAGTVTVQGDGNTIASSKGIGLSVVNSTIGASDLNFVSINASNASSGIVLNNTGALGGLTVTGKAGTADSGGSISGTTGSAAIVATNTQDLNLAWMKIQNSTGHGIDATNLRGSNALANSEISGFGMGVGNVEDGVRIVNNNANMTSLTVTDTTFSNAGGANDGIFVEAQGTSNMTLSVVNNTFTQFYGDAIQVNGITGSTGTVRLVVKDSDFTNAVASGNGGIVMMPSGDLNFIADIDNNVFSAILNNISTLGAVGVANGYTADADVTIRNNDLDNIIGGRGITVTADGGTTDLLIDNNTIDGLGSSSAAAIHVNYTTGTGTATGNVTVSNNIIGKAAPLWTSGDGTANAILLQTLDGATMTALIQNNVVDANTQFEVVRVRAAGTGTSVMNATVEDNELRDTALATTRVEFDASAGTAAQNGILNLSISANIMNGGGLQLSEGALGTLNVAQSSLLQVGATNDANPSSSGTPAFGQSTPQLPSTPSTPLMAMHGPVAGQDAGTLALDDLKALAEAAIARWVEAGIDAEQLALLESVAFGVADLKGSILGLSSAGLVLVDSNAAGWGWFVDDTPMADEEFSASESTEGQAATRMDLLTVLTHELGHILGLDDDYVGGQNAVMHGLLDIGQRYIPEAQLVGVAPALFGDGG